MVLGHLFYQWQACGGTDTSDNSGGDSEEPAAMIGVKHALPRAFSVGIRTGKT